MRTRLPTPASVDLARIELATLSCEDSGIPFTYRPASVDAGGHGAALYQVSYWPLSEQNPVAPRVRGISRGVCDPPLGGSITPMDPV